MKIIFLLLSICVSANTYALTWDEPWQKEVIKEADSFGLYAVVKNSGDSLRLELIRHIAGKRLKPKISVSSFYRFRVASSSSNDHDSVFYYKPGQNVYLFLKESRNKLQIASPTAGNDEVLENGNVAGSFRISMHKAEIDTKTYEAAQSCFFSYFHSGKCKSNVVGEIIEKPLKERVGELSKEASQKDAELFFRQHVALEASYLIKHQNSYETLKPFLDSKFFHVQMSAIRALSVTTSDTKITQIIEFITKSGASDTAKVMAIVMLDELNFQGNMNELENYLDSASKEEVSIVAGLMDPRISTVYPESVHAAIKWFIATRTKSKT